MTRFFVGVGSNSDPETNLLEALTHLSKVARITALSTFHRTPAIGHPSDPPFTNGVVTIETNLSPFVVKTDLLKGIEHALGRSTDPDPHSPRTVDLDLLLSDRQHPAVPIPRAHPDVETRYFVAHALLEVAGDLRLAEPVGQLSQHVANMPSSPMRALPRFTDVLRRRFLPEPILVKVPRTIDPLVKPSP